MAKAESENRELKYRVSTVFKTAVDNLKDMGNVVNILVKNN